MIHQTKALKSIKIYSIICDRFEKELKYTCDYLLDWFPKLGSHAGFSNRLNQLSEAFRSFTSSLFEDFLPSDCFSNQSLLDSMPIITCSGKRLGKVAKDLTDKGYCSTKSLYYYGVKLHALAFRRLNKFLFQKIFR